MRRSSLANSKFKPPRKSGSGNVLNSSSSNIDSAASDHDQVVDQQHSPDADPLKVPEIKLTKYQDLLEEKKNLELQIELLENEGNDVEQLQDYLELLHKYNDMKDCAQMIMGRIAVLSGTTIRDVANKLKAPPSDPD